VLGLQDIQGYNPIQPQRYVDLMRAINGFAQEYHEANIYAAGLDSPLLDLLNPRYIVIPAAIPPGRADLRRLVARHATVFADDAVRVLEDRTALPRAWLVHEARRVEPGAALAPIASGAVDPRRVALVEGDLPPLAVPADQSSERAVVTHFAADELSVEVTTQTPALLVLSETFDPNWRAAVDGMAVPLLVAAHVLRAVPVPVGNHLVAMWYASPLLDGGTLASVGGYALLIVVWGAAVSTSYRKRGPATAGGS
jgi:hypothetical protein